MTTGHVTAQDERTRDAALVARIERQMPERRARPRCTHTAENMMRMGYGDCPACVPRFASLEELRATAPDVGDTEEGL